MIVSRRLFAFLLLAALALPAARAHAQEASPPAAPSPVSGQPQVSGQGVSGQGVSGQPSEIDALVRILQDDKARAALIERLKGAAPQTAAPAAPAPSAEPQGPNEATKSQAGDGPLAAPDPAAAAEAAKKAEGAAEPTFARRIAEYTRSAAERGAALVVASATFAGDLGSIVQKFLSGDAFNIPQLIAVAFTIAVTFGVFFGLRALGIPFYRWIGRRAATAGLAGRAGLLFASFFVDALMVTLAWAGGYVFALQFGWFGVMNIQQTLYLNAFFAVEIVKVVMRAATSPKHASLRVLPIGDEAAAYWYFWGSRIVSTLGYTFLFVAPILAAAVSPAAAQAVRVVVAFATLMMAVAIVLQNRERVRERLAGDAEHANSDALTAFYAFLARFWHWVALAWLGALFVTWLANPQEALPFMALATVQTLAAAALGALAIALISRLIAGGMRLPDDVRMRLPALEKRLNAFIPAILKVVRIVVLVVVLLTIAQSWALLDLVGWLSSEAGSRFATSTITAGIIVLVGVAAYLGMSSWIEYRLNPEFGHVPNAREKTLLTLFRNAFTIALVVLVAMLALSQIGVDIAPLLAGAGVLGLAIGFGAQKLVQDIITGAFIQLENAMNTGDNVKVGGVQGTVEHLTIRSVGIRSVDGVYHLIPFSSVDAVSNATKVFSYHMAEIGVAYRENIPDVKAAMQEAFDILKETETHGPSIIGPFELHGLTKFGDSAITVRGRIKTEPGKQWPLGRAYNEILKEIFDERGIEMPYPHMTIYMGEDREGKAPPLRVEGRIAAEAVPPKAAPRALRPRTESGPVTGHDGPADEGGSSSNA